MNNKREEQAPRNSRGGFTLIEILLVVVIIGMLAGIAAVSVPKHLEKARRSKAAADISSVSMAIQSFYMEEGHYPPNLDVLSSGNDPYLEKGLPKDPWGQPYQYAFPGAHHQPKFDLYSYGADSTPSGDDIVNWQTDNEKL